jgi:hypothetical protein
MVVRVKNQVHAVVDQQATCQLQSSDQPPNVDYPGCEIDLSATRDAISSGSKSETLRMYRKMKEKQRVFDHYLNVNESNNGTYLLDELEYDPENNNREKRDIEQRNDKNRSDNKNNDDIFRDNKLEDLRSKKEDIVYGGDRFHPNIVAIKSLFLTYPGWEEDVKGALDCQSFHLLAIFQDKFHSLKVKQDLHDGDRSHWRLLKLDDLNLTYPGCRKDIKQVKDWHIANADNRKNTVIFHEVIEGMLDQQQIYLGWDHGQVQNPFPDVDKIDAQIYQYRRRQVTKEEEENAYDEMKYSDNSKNAILDKLIDQKKKVLEKRSLLKSTRSSKSTSNKEKRDPETANRRQMESNNAYHLRPMNSKTPAGSKLGKCQVCSTRTKTHVCVPCGHLACAACSYHSLRTTTRCSICNEHADKVVRVEL